MTFTPSASKQKPNLFLVGAPRCGTTSMHSYLGQHPEIFMSQVKEPEMWGQDVRYSRLTLESYFRLFACAGDEKWLGEASTSYLCSHLAAAQIKEFAPESRILIMLRNPVDVLYSMHKLRYSDGIYRHSDLGAELQAEEERRSRGEESYQGREARILTGYRASLYELGAFTNQVERFFNAFDRDNVHVIIFEDLERDTAAVYADTLRFLEVADDFQADLKPLNPLRVSRSRTFQTLTKPLRRIKDLMSLPSFGVRRITHKSVRPPPIDPELRIQLTAHFKPEIESLSVLLNRDLMYWSRRNL